MECYKCGVNPHEANVVLIPKEDSSLFECSPACNVEFINPTQAVMHAVDLSEGFVAVGRLLLKKHR